MYLCLCVRVTLCIDERLCLCVCLHACICKIAALLSASSLIEGLLPYTGYRVGRCAYACPLCMCMCVSVCVCMYVCMYVYLCICEIAALPQPPPSSKAFFPTHISWGDADSFTLSMSLYVSGNVCMCSLLICMCACLCTWCLEMV